MKLKFKHPFKLLLLLGFLLRLVLVYFQYSGDVGNHLVWGQGTLEGLFGFFNRQFPGFNDPNYPPLTILIFGFFWRFYLLKSAIFNWLNQVIPLFPSKLIPLMGTLNMQAAFMKLPAILADLGTAGLLYRLLPEKKTKQKLILTSLYLFNPAVIYISTVWGQIESITLFFLLLSLYFYFRKGNRNYYLSHLSFVLACLIKQTALWLLPAYLIIWFKKKDLKTFFRGIVFQLVTFILIYLPFTHNLIDPFKLYLSTLSGSSTVIADAAWNFWSFFYPASINDSVTLLGLSVRYWSVGLILLSCFLISYRLWKKSNKENIFLSFFLLSLVAFFLQTRVHERHLAPALFFLFLVSFKDLRLKYLSLISLSLYHFLNLYFTLGLPFV